jgi:sporulation protein YlmC with PRC-barrel domain
MAAALPEDSFISFSADQVRASTLMGQEVLGPDQESIGEISDLVLQEDGETRAALIDVGGFLGVGEKEVAIPFDQIEVSEDGDEAILTVALTREELEQLPAFEQATIGEADTAATDQSQMPADQQPADQQPADMAAAPADQPADATAPAEQPADMAAAPADQQPMAEGEAQFATATQDLSAEQLIGAAVYSPEEENLGEVGDVLFDEGGAIEAVVIDVGGFLGMGEKPVAVTFDALNVQKDTNGDVTLMLNATQEELEAAPSYEETVEAESQTVQ